MGQQQLILLVLAVVIVGLAIIVGIRAFSENNVKANADALTQDALRIANDLQAWMIKPEAFGGATAADKAAMNFGAATWAQLGYPEGTTACAEYGNTNGCFTLAGGVITATSAGSDNALATALTVPNTVQVTVTGLTDTAPDLATVITIGQY